MKFGQWLDEIPKKGSYPFEDPGTERCRSLVPGEDHLKFGIEVVNVVQGVSFWSFGNNRRAEGLFAVMGGDQVEQMHPDIFRIGIQAGPLSQVQFAPERVYQFDAN